MQASTSRSVTVTVALARFLSIRSPIRTTPALARSIHFRPLPTSSSARRSSIASPSRTFFSLPDISKLAGLNSSAESNDPSGVETDGEQQRFHARKILPYTRAQLYSLIADVPSYSSFIPFCTSSAVLSPKPSATTSDSISGSGGGAKSAVDDAWKPDDQPFDVEAEMSVGFGGLEERYVSRVTGRPFESVTATASDQPLFKSLVTTWAFSPASPLSPHASNASSSASPSPSTPEPRHPGSTTESDANPESGPTLLTIDLAFAFVNPLHRIASQAVLPKVAERMVEAFEKRCLVVFGRGRE